MNQPDTTVRSPDLLRVVILTSEHVDEAMASALSSCPSVNLVGVLAAPLPRPRSWRRRLRTAYRRHGIAAFIRLPLLKLARAVSGSWRNYRPHVVPHSTAPRVRLSSFHDADGLATIRALQPDVVVVDGTYILPPEVFLLPRITTLNLHCGKLPEFRGAPPVFWELYSGAKEVGVTVHGVTAAVDGGPLFAQRVFSLPTRIAGDPMKFARDMWLNVLRPAGIQLMADTLQSIASGTARPVPQIADSAVTHRSPDWRAIRQLRKLVRQRNAH